MRQYQVKFTSLAYEQLDALADYIAENGYRSRAEGYIAGIIDYCYNLGKHPAVGRARDDLSPGLRVVGYKNSATIAFRVLDDEVVVISVFYRGRDCETLLTDK